jgi:hypothetical protein
MFFEEGNEDVAAVVVQFGIGFVLGAFVLECREVVFLLQGVVLFGHLTPGLSQQYLLALGSNVIKELEGLEFFTFVFVHLLNKLLLIQELLIDVAFVDIWGKWHSPCLFLYLFPIDIQQPR